MHKILDYDCESYSSLISDFSRSLAEAKQFIDKLKEPAGFKHPELSDGEIFYDADDSEVARPNISDFNLPDPVKFLNFNVGEGLDVDSFKRGITFNRIGSRHVAHFGPVSYQYGSIPHPALDYPDSPALDSVFTSIRDNMQVSDFTKEHWCCLVTLYENGRSTIPFHSDDEDSIVPGSDIITVSIGSTRSLVFQNIIGPITDRPSYDLVHGSVHSMTTESQLAWEHSIPPSDDPNCGPRISLTFRKLQVPVARKVPPISKHAKIDPQPIAQSNPPASSGQPRPKPKRLLFLSDSIHMSFPTHVFNPSVIVCVKKKLPNFCLSDIHQFEHEFAYTDYVFLSCGVNDLSRFGWSAQTLFKYFSDLIRCYRKKYPNTVFVYNSILSTKYEWLNIEINKFNIDVFNLSLEIGQLDNRCNLWFLDSHHLALTASKNGMQILETGFRLKRANGVHITFWATKIIRETITQCLGNLILGNCHTASVSWPLRDQFAWLAANPHR